MAVRASNFEIAALDADQAAPDAEENVVELDHGNGYFSLWRRPSAGQYALFQLRVSRDTGTERMKGLDRFFGALVLTPEEAVAGERKDEHGVLYADRVDDGDTAIGMDFFWDLVERGRMDQEKLMDMLKEAVEIHSGFPTESAPASSTSRRTSGQRSTAGSRRVKSTPSPSASDGS